MNTELIARMKNAADVIGGNIAAVLQDAVRELENAPDLTDVAYLGKGCAEALAKLDASTYGVLSEGGGECGLIEDMVSTCAPLVQAAWAAVGEDGVGGCWAYEVCEPLGHLWVAEALKQDAPPTAKVMGEHVARLVERMG
ncbi:hypothetical protein [Stenotrophomonas oahuensis]|uniref:Uncharacterized protein n=1 Tax=Stenotrophomonas oahuensis TaxID=3003271 RepID=A0ABY9YP53_9GAMM|nr:hypothetical protein [Stenotrophomonas sp. A5586]WNH52410.1 hypothetical protein PDM29_19135 [Stenotrophomonas sp. A5586]